MTSTGRLAERSEATRAVLLAASRELFADGGFASTTIEEIVQLANVTRGALYHHFSGKEELFRAVYEAAEAELADRSLAAAGRGADPVEQVLLGCEAFFDACLDPAIQRIVLLDAPSVLGWKEWHEIGTRYSFGLLRLGLQAAMDDGMIGKGDVETLAHLVQGALIQAGMAIARADDAAEARRSAGREVAKLLDGLRLIRVSS